MFLEAWKNEHGVVEFTLEKTPHPDSEFDHLCQVDFATVQTVALKEDEGAAFDKDEDPDFEEPARG